jgi:hypothetical protein
MSQIPTRGGADELRAGDLVLVLDTPASQLLAGLSGVLVAVSGARATVLLADEHSRRPVAPVEIPLESVTALEQDPGALGLG